MPEFSRSCFEDTLGPAISLTLTQLMKLLFWLTRFICCCYCYFRPSTMMTGTPNVALWKPESNRFGLLKVFPLLRTACCWDYKGTTLLMGVLLSSLGSWSPIDPGCFDRCNLPSPPYLLNISRSKSCWTVPLLPSRIDSTSLTTTKAPWLIPPGICKCCLF